MPTISGSDAQRIALARHADSEAFEVLVEERRDALLRLLAAMLAHWDEAEAEDALQEALWHAYRAIGGRREARAFDGGLRQSMVNAGRQRLRAAVARIRREGAPVGAGDDDIEGLNLSAEPPSLEALASRERHAELLRTISGLLPQQRRLAGLVWVARLPVHDAARASGVPPGGVYAALHRARRTAGGMTTRARAGRASDVGEGSAVRHP